jgi:hypothetical protein
MVHAANVLTTAATTNVTPAAATTTKHKSNKHQFLCRSSKNIHSQPFQQLLTLFIILDNNNELTILFLWLSRFLPSNRLSSYRAINFELSVVIKTQHIFFFQQYQHYCFLFLTTPAS